MGSNPVTPTITKIRSQKRADFRFILFKTANLLELSQILGYSTVYTDSIVKKLTGETFSKTVLLKRCKMAAYMLLSTNFSIHEIIHMVGYESKSFFRKVFKNKYGETLSEYRNKRSN